MILVPRRQVWTQQPQCAVAIDQAWIARGLKFAVLPSVGLINLAGPSGAIQSDGFSTEVIPSGIAYNGNHKAEYLPILPNNVGVTLVSVWRSRAASQYISADSTRILLSNRTSSNLGWGWGRASAVGGGAGGNKTAQTFVVNGVAQYSEANYTIESLVDTPVACRYSQATGKVAWFAFGKKTSADSTASTSPTTGGNVVFGAGGDYAGSNSPWIDRASVILGFVGELSDAEVYTLSNSVNAIWQIFKRQDSRIWVPVSAGSGSIVTTITGGATASAAGAQLNVSMLAGVGSASAQGVAATLSCAIQTTTGAATAQGVAAALNASIQTTAAGVFAQGVASNILHGVTVQAAAGNATAQGAAANLNSVIQTTTVSAFAQGVSASLSGALTISTVAGNATAVGQASLLNTSIVCSVGNASAAIATALIESGASILTTAGGVSAQGIVAAINTSIATIPAGAVAQGVTGGISTPFSTLVYCFTGQGEAVGVPAIVFPGVLVLERVEVMSRLLVTSEQKSRLNQIIFKGSCIH